MSIEEIILAITALFSLGAIVVAGMSYRNSKKSAQVSTELLIQQLISGARKDTHEFSYAISEDKKKVAGSLLDAYIEQELNTYDVACASYLDKKIDRDRFYKTYATEIQNLFEKSEATQRILNRNGRYHAIKKVYDEWFNREK